MASRLATEIELNGKTALVTGGSRGIGRSTALALAAAGARVLLHYANSESQAEQAVADIRREGGEADKIRADLESRDGAHDLAKQVRSMTSRVDILVANAGVSTAKSIEDTTVGDFDRLFNVNVRAPYFLVQQLLPILTDKASVIFISSLAAHASVGQLSAYAASKGAIDTLIKHFAVALGPRGVRVNAVAPGVVDTEMSSLTKNEAGRAATLAMQALKRIAGPAEIADVVTFLASDKARWISGDTIRVDGGSKL
jgi:NAD(P)-dependent dehydrogenase (short-subunit alcohol dehydrogenase family)